MKVIFLDNDGVICLASNWGSRYKKRKQTYTEDNPMSMDVEPPVEYRFDDFDTKAIKVLNDILTETRAEIVVSSDWKLHATVELEATPQILGMVRKVNHLIKVEEI